MLGMHILPILEMKALFTLLISMILGSSVTAGEQKESKPHTPFGYVLLNSDTLLEAKVRHLEHGRYQVVPPFGIDEEYILFRCTSDIELTVDVAKKLIDHQGLTYVEERYKKPLSLLYDTTIEPVVTLELIGDPSDPYHVKATIVHHDLKQHSGGEKFDGFVLSIIGLFCLGGAILFNCFVKPTKSVVVHLLTIVWAALMLLWSLSEELFRVYMFWYISAFLAPFVIALIVKSIRDWRDGDEPRGDPDLAQA